MCSIPTEILVHKQISYKGSLIKLRGKSFNKSSSFLSELLCTK